VRQSWKRGLAITAVAALALAGCGDDNGDEPQDETPEEMGDEEALDDLMGDSDMEDPNEDIEDGVYAGSGVLLPVPDGWQLDPQAMSQGIVAAISEDQQQQMSARAIDTAEAEAQGQDMDFDVLLDSVREQLGQDAEVDEEVDFENAERAQRLTYTALPPQQEGMPESDVTIVLAEDGNGLVGEFTFAAPSDEYDEALADQLLAEGGFDPDSEPPEMPQMQQPAPEGEGGEMSDEEMQEQMEQFEEQMEQEQQDQ
jgi:hypothetical protein